MQYRLLDQKGKLVKPSLTWLIPKRAWPALFLMAAFAIVGLASFLSVKTDTRTPAELSIHQRAKAVADWAHATYDRDSTIHPDLRPYVASAVTQQYKTGIPAAITLAQLIWESNMGKSRLARKANNLFGVKGGKSGLKATDDSREDRFKRFASKWQAIVQHSSLLLTHAAYRPLREDDWSNVKPKDATFDVRGEDGKLLTKKDPLFQQKLNYVLAHDKEDMEYWATALDLCCYATSGKYSQRLMATIKEYNLERFNSIPEEVIALAYK